MTEPRVLLRSQGGEINGAVVAEDNDALAETLREWALDPATEAILKVPVEVARKSLFEPTAPVIAEMGL